jgi:hypothetical protein
MLTKTTGHEQEGKPKYSIAKAIIGLSLIGPWAVIEMVLRRRDPSFGYSAGLFLGFTTAYLLLPRPPRLWVMALIAMVLAISHFVFVTH